MKFNENMKRILMKRIQYNGNGLQLCGCFTYAEIVYLWDVLKVGNKNDFNYHSNKGIVEFTKEMMSLGMSGRRWFYFTTRKDLAPGLHRHDTKKVYKQGSITCTT